MPDSGSAQIDLMARLSDSERTALLQIGQIRHYARHDFIFRAGEGSRNVFLLLRGRVKIFQPSTAGKEAILWFCFGGELFGLAEAARGGERVVSAQASDRCEILCIRQEQFQSYLEAHPPVALTVIQLLSCRLRLLGDIAINLISDDVPTRVMKMIVQMGARWGVPTEQGLRLDIPLTHQEIADMIGTSRQTITTVLGQLQRSGLLSVDRRRISITDRQLLARLGDGRGPGQ